MPTFIRELNAIYIKEGGLAGDALDWDRSRGSDFRCLAQALYIIEKFAEGQVNYSTLLQLEKWLERSPEPTPKFCEKVHNTYRVFVDLVHDTALKEVFGAPTRVSPIEFIMISLLIAVHKDQLTPVQLSAAIGLMRADARAKHVDIRMNGRVAKTMVEFIRGYKASRSNRYDDGEAASLLAGTKRKRDEERSSKMDSDVNMRPLSPPEDRTVNSSQLPQNTSAALPPEKYDSTVMDRLAAIRAAKDKLVSAPVPLPSSNPAALRISLSSSIQPKTENSNPLESSLMARMSSGETAGSLERGNKLTRSRYSSPSRSIEGQSDRDRGRDNHRDRNYGRSVSSERSPQSRTRRPHEGTLDWDYKSHRGRR